MTKLISFLIPSLLAISITLFSSCARKEEKVPQISLHVEPLLQDSGTLKLITPTKIYAFGDDLIIQDMRADSVLIWVDANKKEVAGSFLSYGNGPDQIGRMASINKLSDQEGSIGIFDPGNGRMTEITLESGNGHAVNRVQQLDMYYRVPTLVKLANGCYLSSFSYETKGDLFSIFSPKGRLMNFIGERPISEKDKSLQPLEITAAYQYNIFASPDGNKVAAIGTFGEAAAFYKLENDELVPVVSFFNSDANVDRIFEDGIYRGIEDNQPLGYISASSNDAGVFVLVSDRPLNSEDGLSMTANKIVQFDWDGKKVAEYVTDRRISHLATPCGNGKMYGIMSDNCVPTLVELTVAKTAEPDIQEPSR